MRYQGNEPCTSVSQVVRYLTENYADGDGQPMPEETARQIANANPDALTKGITVFRSNVYYLGDEALKNSGEQGWHELPEPEGADDPEPW